MKIQCFIFQPKISFLKQLRKLERIRLFWKNFYAFSLRISLNVTYVSEHITYGGEIDGLRP